MGNGVRHGCILYDGPVKRRNHLVTITRTADHHSFPDDLVGPVRIRFTPQTERATECPSAGR